MWALALAQGLEQNRNPQNHRPLVLALVLAQNRRTRRSRQQQAAGLARESRRDQQ
jgi:hypothetical protein